MYFSSTQLCHEGMTYLQEGAVDEKYRKYFIFNRVVTQSQIRNVYKILINNYSEELFGYSGMKYTFDGPWEIIPVLQATLMGHNHSFRDLIDLV